MSRARTSVRRRVSPVITVIFMVVGLLSVVAVTAGPARADSFAPAQTVPGTYSLTSVACPSPTACFAVGQVTQSQGPPVVLSITNGVPGAPQTVAGVGVLASIACNTATFCVAVGGGGPTSNPADGVVLPILNGVPGAVQYVPSVLGGQASTALSGIACPSPTSCVAVGFTSAPPNLQPGAVVAITNGVPGAVQPVSGTLDLFGVACPSPTTCEAVGQSANVVGRPTSPAAAVTVANGTAGAVQLAPGSGITGSDILFDVGCSGITTCVASGTNAAGAGVLSTINNGAPGPLVLLPGTVPAPSAIACPSATECEGATFAVVSSTSGLAAEGAMLAIPNGAAGAVETVPGTSFLYGIACGTATSCEAVGSVGSGNDLEGVAVSMTVGAPPPPPNPSLAIRAAARTAFQKGLAPTAIDCAKSAKATAGVFATVTGFAAGASAVALEAAAGNAATHGFNSFNPIQVQRLANKCAGDIAQEAKQVEIFNNDPPDPNSQVALPQAETLTSVDFCPSDPAGSLDADVCSQFQSLIQGQQDSTLRVDEIVTAIDTASNRFFSANQAGNQADADVQRAAEEGLFSELAGAEAAENAANTAVADELNHAQVHITFDAKDMAKSEAYIRQQIIGAGVSASQYDQFAAGAFTTGPVDYATALSGSVIPTGDAIQVASFLTVPGVTNLLAALQAEGFVTGATNTLESDLTAIGDAATSTDLAANVKQFESDAAQLVSGEASLLLQAAAAPLDNQATQSTATTLAALPSLAGQPVAITATVLAQFGNPTSGTVNFYQGNQSQSTTGTLVGSAQVDVNGHAYTTLASTTRGQTLTAVYIGNGGCDPSIATLQVPGASLPSLAPTTTAVSVTPADPDFGTPVTFTATVDSISPNPVSPTGTVSFYLDGQSAPVSTVMLVDSQASVTIDGLAGGANSVVVVYSGDSNFASSSSMSSPFTVGATTTVSGNHPGGLIVTPGSAVLLEDATLAGSVVVESGGSLDLENSTIGGALTASNPGAVRICGSTIHGSLSVFDAGGFVVIGDAVDGCATNTIGGALVVLNNRHGVQVIDNQVRGAVTGSGNSGTGPFPSDTAPEILGNGPR